MKRIMLILLLLIPMALADEELFITLDDETLSFPGGDSQFQMYLLGNYDTGDPASPIGGGSSGGASGPATGTPPINITINDTPIVIYRGDFTTDDVDVYSEVIVKKDKYTFLDSVEAKITVKNKKIYKEAVVLTYYLNDLVSEKIYAVNTLQIEVPSLTADAFACKQQQGTLTGKGCVYTLTKSLKLPSEGRLGKWSFNVGVMTNEYTAATFAEFEVVKKNPIWMILVIALVAVSIIVGVIYLGQKETTKPKVDFEVPK